MIFHEKIDREWESEEKKRIEREKKNKIKRERKKFIIARYQKGLAII